MNSCSGGGIASTDTLNSEAIMINIGDYNSKSTVVLKFVIVFSVYKERDGYEYDI